MEEVIRARLNADRAWSAYALGDLAPDAAPFCDWRIDEDGLVLLYREFTPPVIFAVGDAAALIERIDDPELQLHLQSDALDWLAARYELRAKPVWRMVLDRDAFAPDGAADAIGIEHLASVERLYADGDAANERPDFFFASMIERGVFRGVWEDRELIAVAGTHLVNGPERVATIGNVYTRRDRRGRGLARRAASAVTEELLRRGIETVALNVRMGNDAATRVYERLGFRRHCEYFEGSATKRQ